MQNKVGNFQAIELNTTGFDKLNSKQQKLVYHLTLAGQAGSRISLKQTSQYNEAIIQMFIDLYKKTKNHDNHISKQIKSALFILFLHSGIYHHTSGEKLKLEIDDDTLNFILENATDKQVFLFTQAFSFNTPNFQTVQSNEVDVVLNSGVAFYPSKTTRSEIEEFQTKLYANQTEEDMISPFGFNTIISRDENEELKAINIYASQEKTSFSDDCHHIIFHLKNALSYVENKQQENSILSLIRFYETGDPVDFDKHCVEWVNDQNSSIYFINGLIESYDDPLGRACTFESIVAFKNPNDVDRVNAIIDNIQWFEENLPVEQRFKKEKAKGLSASSVNVISMSGKTSPCLPLGINLPNSDWIRNKYGSKSVTLANVSNSRSHIENPLTTEMFLPEYQSLIVKHLFLNKNLHIDLHEVAGHGSGQVLEGVSKSDLSIYYSVIEECRADLVALYYAGSDKLEEFGIYPKNKTEEIATAQYVSYITDGLLTQLRRVKLGNDLTQAHLRNRQLISSWLLSHCRECDILLLEKGGKHFIKINNINNVRLKIGELLSEIQRIKSMGDFEAAKGLVETYGTKINKQIHIEVLDRINKLGLSELVGYISPILQQRENGEIFTKLIPDFVDQQIELWDFFN